MNKRATIGSLLWLSVLQYFIVQLFVAAAWPFDYSWANNYISDLGNTVCGVYGGMLVCSPWHNLMNASFVALGLAQFVGAFLLIKTWGRTSLTRLGFGSVLLAGIGTIIVGLFPENSVQALHISGSSLPFAIGNLGLILFGIGLVQLPKSIRVLTGALGAVALIALILFMTRTYLGLGIGGMERLVAYPQTLWLFIFGSYSLARNDTQSVR